MDITVFYNLIKNNNSFMVTSHISPDGDSIGSLLAMTHVLLDFGKKVTPVVNDDIPEKYKFLPGSNLIIKENTDFYDAIICLDSGDEERLGFKKSLKEYGSKIINIDHHKSNTFFGDFNIIDSSASSVGEILYRLLENKVAINYNIALNIYTSIITDTGSVKYSNTTPLTLKILAELVAKGIKPDFVSRHVFEKRSLSSIELLKLALDTLEISAEGKLASLYITQDMIKTTGAKDEDTDGIINYPREIEGVEVAVLFKEYEESLIKVGFRSNDWVDVGEIAEKFNGGGHLRAAGCTLKQTLPKSREIVLNTIKKHLMEDSPCEVQ